MGSHAASQFLLLLWSIISSRPEIRAFYFAVQYSSCIFTRRRIPAVSKKSLPRYFAQTRRLPLQLQRIPRAPISNPFSFIPQISRITSISFSHTNVFSSFLRLPPDPGRKPQFGNLPSPLLLILEVLLNFIRLLHLRDFRFLRKRNRRRGSDPRNDNSVQTRRATQRVSDSI